MFGLDLTNQTHTAESIARDYPEGSQALDRALEELKEPALSPILDFIAGRQLFMCETARETCLELLGMLSNDSEKKRAEEWWKRISIVADGVSERWKPVVGARRHAPRAISPQELHHLWHRRPARARHTHVQPGLCSLCTRTSTRFPTLSSRLPTPHLPRQVHQPPRPPSKIVLTRKRDSRRIIVAGIVVELIRLETIQWSL